MRANNQNHSKTLSKTGKCYLARDSRNRCNVLPKDVDRHHQDQLITEKCFKLRGFNKLFGIGNSECLGVWIWYFFAKLYLWKLILVSLWSHLKLMGECWNFFDDWKAENEPGQIGSYWCWWVVRILLTDRGLVSSQPLCRLRVQFLSCLTAHPTVHSFLRDNWKTTKRWLCEQPPPCVSTAHWAAPTY